MTDFLRDSDKRRDTYVGNDRIEGDDPIAEGGVESHAYEPIDRTTEFHAPDESVGHGVQAHEKPVATPLFPAGESDAFRSRWVEIQTRFVDEPRQSVEQADTLVKEVTDRLVSVFTTNRDDLERQWSAGEDVSTEDLRLALQRYRSFFERLLSV